MSARALFVGGTSSNAGKSWMATAICAWLRRQGVAVAPFKAQNMSNNSFPCVGGGEIGRAQVAQAEACGLDPEPAMNPVLLKPSGQGTSQVVVNGRVWKTLSAGDYYAQADQLRGVVLDAYTDLSRRFEVVVIEGAGSVTELNLRDHDLVNLGLVTRIGAPWILVADIERGGVFASVIGTVGLLEPDERALFCGFLVNKFRGDLSLFDDGARLLEARTSSPCLGVFPYASDICLDAEDSLATSAAAASRPAQNARVAIVRLPHLSNSTDFRLLAGAEWITAPSGRPFDAIILPGSKNTIADLAWLRTSGLANWVIGRHQRGTRIVGICGGFQMLGRLVSDPCGVESAVGAVAGLGLLPAETTLEAEKVTRTVRATTAGGTTFSAFEIHMGRTRLDADGTGRPFAWLDDGTAEGTVCNGVTGTYLHGALEDPAVCVEVLGIDPGPALSRSSQYAKLADWFGRHARGVESLGLVGRS